ncbi:hypothetical protein BDR03DRAFT_985366 [Suillus americanus]|nr:hypothetical protein BDR03DRAFT_985366 [Suillus americanus]
MKKVQAIAFTRFSFFRKKNLDPIARPIFLTLDNESAKKPRRRNDGDRRYLRRLFRRRADSERWLEEAIQLKGPTSPKAVLLSGRPLASLAFLVGSSCLEYCPQVEEFRGCQVLMVLSRLDGWDMVEVVVSRGSAALGVIVTHNQGRSKLGFDQTPTHRRTDLCE